MHTDTIALLGACTAGIDTAVCTINDLLPRIHDRRLRQKLQDGIDDHQLLRSHACGLLERCGGSEKLAGPLEKSALRIRMGARMALHGDDTTAAFLVADSCDSSVRALCRHQNRHCMAHPDAIRLTQELIRCKESLSAGLRPYL